jgi:hypothetical protein
MVNLLVECSSKFEVCDGRGEIINFSVEVVVSKSKTDEGGG